MRTDVHQVARHVDRVPITLAPRTVFALIGVLIGLAGVALFGIGLVQVWGGIWSALGFVICVAVTALAGFDLAPSAPGVGSGGDHKSAARSAIG